MTDVADATGASPLVSVALPTFRRPDSLRRAAESVLAQTHARLELVIYDDGSNDGTRAVAEGLRDLDPRVRYLRRERNRGLTASFNDALAACRGEYAMLLGDDDWLDPELVERCLAALRSQPRAAAACGRVIQHWPNHVAPARTPEVLERSPARRVLSYYRQVRDDTGVNGLLSRATLELAPAFRNAYGHDWQRGASLAFLGPIVRVEEARVHRTRGGSSEGASRLVRTMGLPRWQGRRHFATLAVLGAADILWRSPVYRALPLGRRVALALACPLGLRRELAAPFARRVRRMRRRIRRWARHGRRRMRRAALALARSARAQAPTGSAGADAASASEARSAPKRAP